MGSATLSFVSFSMVSRRVVVGRPLQDQFDRHPENLQFGESADRRSLKFVNDVNCCPCLGFSTLDVML